MIAIASRFGKKVFTALGLSNTFSLRLGESIHIENSYKYSNRPRPRLARVSSWELLQLWTDARGRALGSRAHHFG
ncbi:L-histidine N(alpha)-methyltransferase, partial [Caballeronia sp.]|uniref:L-histidine N(alpha)-methyltransferase n=1 Tax=Caballeronia sp. TaxID=1931223 RepID=UPI003C5504FA